MLSVVVKNTAVSIAVPIVCFVGCFIATTYMLAFGNRLTWLVYTPIPYVQLSSFFIQYSPVQQMMQNGVAISMPFGVTLLLVLSAVCTFVSILVFNKRDITN
jgi:ABC-type transport system involved in multi-copper enzyme maturation permease subunit